MNNEFMIPSDEALMMTEHLLKLQDRFGIPSEITNADLSPIVWKFIVEIMRMFKISYYHDYKEWVDGVQEYLLNERPIQEALKGGGTMSISYPEKFFELMKAFFPNLKLQEKTFTKEIIKHIPELRRSNYS